MLKQKFVLFFATILFPLFVLAAETLIVFDAGSTGTRLHLFSVEAGQNGPKISSLASTKVSPGLSDPSFRADPTLLGPYFAKLLKAVDANLTAEQKAHTSINLYATAGMRMLPLADQTVVFDAARTHLSKESKLLGYAPISDPVQQIRAATGGEEGLFVWIADNDLLGHLDTDQTLDASNTVGALELGGASAEISFISAPPRHYLESFLHQNKKYSIYSTGYDGLGVDQTLASTLKHFQRQGGDFAACFPKGAAYPIGNPVLTGAGDFTRCQAYLESVMLDAAEVKKCHARHGQHCSGFGRYQPTAPQTNYVLTSAFYYTFKILGIADQGVTSTYFKQSGREFCAKSWDELQSQYPNENPTFLMNYCFNASWMSTLFDAWHISSNANLMAIDKKDGVTVSWPEGAAYYHVMD